MARVFGLICFVLCLFTLNTNALNDLREIEDEELPPTWNKVYYEAFMAFYNSTAGYQWYTFVF